MNRCFQNYFLKRFFHPRRCRHSIPEGASIPLFHYSIIPLTLLYLFLLSENIFAEIRYVSKTGSSTPPYLSWETASDSIQKCINISNFGDTIYVGNGVYKEKVVMTDGLALIGSGMDSCIIDTKELVDSIDFISVEVGEDCVFQNFHIVVYSSNDMGFAIKPRNNSIIKFNQISDAGIGIFPVNSVLIYKNIIKNVVEGIFCFNSSSVIKCNYISTGYNPNTTVSAGVDIEAYNNSFTPVIDSNYIETNWIGIYKSFGSDPIISNNIIMLNGPGAQGIKLGSADSAKVYNNLIYAVEAYEGIINLGAHYLQVYNNYITGIDKMLHSLQIGPDNVAKNIVITNSTNGVRKFANQPDPIFQYNNVWNNDVNYMNFTPDSTNISVNPMVVNDDINQGDLDFHLQMYSRLIDAGEPDMLDKDSTRSDIGLYGGPFGESYKYEDIPPSPPRGLSVSADTGYVTIKWRKNTETDFDYYKLYRDTLQNFIANETTLISNQADTSYIHIINPKVEGYYYKLKGVDKQGNESKVSEEINIITDVSGEAVIVNDYTLFQNYPNPFNPTTIIGYRLKERGYVKVMVYTPSGELIEVLVNQEQESGYYEREFNPQGRLSSGVYIYQIIVKNENNIPVFSDMKKMLLLK